MRWGGGEGAGIFDAVLPVGRLVGGVGVVCGAGAGVGVMWSGVEWSG